MVYFNDLNENAQAVHDLKQGKQLINRQRNLIMNEIDKFKNFETFTNTKKLDKISVKENHVLGDMEDEYNKLISQYGTKYATFMRKYAKLSGDVDRCAAECLNIHPTSASNYSKRRKACVAGCELKGPFILQCKDTFTKDSDGKKCPQIVGDNCIGGRTINHQQMINKRDERGRTARSGCCECGGGAGGKRTTKVNGNTVRSCNDRMLTTALGGYTGKNFCRQAPYASPESAANFYKEYQTLSAHNEKIMDKARFLFNKIKNLRSIDKKLLSNTEEEHSKLERTLNDFTDSYTKLNKLQKPYTATAQQENAEFLVGSGQSKVAAWSVLAITITYILFYHLKD